MPETHVFTVAGHSIYLIHDLKELALDPRVAGFAVVIAGHSHKPKIESRDGVLFLNPGSAGPRRFKLPVTLATLDVSRTAIHAETLFAETAGRIVRAIHRRLARTARRLAPAVHPAVPQHESTRVDRQVIGADVHSIKVIAAE